MRLTSSLPSSGLTPKDGTRRTLGDLVMHALSFAKNRSKPNRSRLRGMMHALLATTLLSGVPACKKGAKTQGGPPGGFAAQVVAVKVGRQPVTERLSVVGNVMANETVDLDRKSVV